MHRKINNGYSSKFAQKYKLHENETAVYWLAFLAFLESSVFLLPVDVLYIPMLLRHPNKAYRYAFVATVFSVLGAILGWVIGAFAYKTIALPILQFYGKQEYIEHLRSASNLKLIISFLISSGLVHLPPIKLVNILAGLMHINLFVFIILNAIARFCRLYGLAWASKRYGEQFMRIIHHWLDKFMGRESLLNILIFITSVVIVATSFIMQYKYGYLPCKLCMIERSLFGLAAVFSFILIILFYYKNPRRYLLSANILLNLSLLSNVVLSGYHYGVEKHWWSGPSSCSSQIGNLPTDTQSLIKGLTSQQTVYCDIPLGSFLHLSFTIWSLVLSLMLLTAGLYIAKLLIIHKER